MNNCFIVKDEKFCRPGVSCCGNSFMCYVCAQNETHCVEVSSTETSKPCTYNVTGRDYVCEEVQNTTEVMPSTEVRKDSDGVSVTIDIVDVESTLPP